MSEQSEREDYNSYRREVDVSLEYCVMCGTPTGKAGRGEDSIYCPDCDEGPLCEECWGDEKHNPENQPKPIGKCKKCGRDVYSEVGFCGGCTPDGGW